MAVFCPHTVLGGGLHDLEDGWIVPLPLVGDLLGYQTVTKGKARAKLNKWFSVGQSRLFGMEELPLYRVAAGVSQGFCQFALAWQRLGSELYCEDQLRVRALLGGRWRLIVIGGTDFQKIPNETGHEQAVVELGVICPSRDKVFIQAVWPLLPPPSWQGGRSQRRWLCVAGRLDGARWALAVDRDGSGVPSFQVETIVKVAGGLAWGLRSEPTTGSIGMTTCWLWSHLLLRTSHVVHPDLGVTHRWSLTWGNLLEIW